MAHAISRKAPRSEFSRRPEKQRKEQVELNEHGEIPPGRIQVVVVHLDIHEPQTEQAQHDAAVDLFGAHDERRNQVNQMRDPVHRIETQKPRAIPHSPGQRARLCATRGRFHERPAAQDDENAHRMEAEPGDLEPHGSQNSHGGVREVAPVGWRKLAVLEVSPEKMKVNDPENGESLRDIEPEEPLHRRWA